jgi:hypothetical protein
MLRAKGIAVMLAMRIVSTLGAKDSSSRWPMNVITSIPGKMEVFRAFYGWSRKSSGERPVDFLQKRLKQEQSSNFS